MMKNQNKYYKPEIVTENPVKMSKSGFTGSLPEGTVDGFINTGLEQDVIIQRISKDLYAKPESGIRELYANEARACREARRLGADPMIKLTVNPATREITLEGIDSMGITWDTFSNVCCVLGRSSNFNGKESGQFGMGMASYTCISDIMFIDTYSRETGEKYSVMGKSGIGFQTGLPTPDMEHFGTRVRVTARKDVDLEDIFTMIKKCAEMSTVRTVIKVVENNLSISSYEEYAGELSQLTLSDNIKMSKREPEDETVFYKDNICNLEDDEIEIAYNVIIRWYVNNYSHNPSYLCGIPIDYKYDGKYKENISNIAVNIKNERKYRPTPDRERFSGDVATRINKKIDSMIDGHIESICESTNSFSEYIANSDARILDSMLNPLVVNDKMRQFFILLSMPATATLRNEERLGYLIKGPNFLITDSLRKNEIAAIHDHDPSISVVRIKDYANDRVKFESRGIKTAKEYIRENGIKISRDATTARKVRVFNPKRHFCPPESFYSDDLPDNLIFLTTYEFETLVGIFGKLSWYDLDEMDFNFVKKNAIGKNPVGISFEEWYKKRLGNYIYSTNKGVKTLNQIFSSKFDLRTFVHADDYQNSQINNSINESVNNDILVIYENLGGNRYRTDHSSFGALIVYSRLAHFSKSLKQNPWVKSNLRDIPNLMLCDTSLDTKTLKKMGIEGEDIDHDTLSIVFEISRIRKKEISDAIITLQQKKCLSEYDIINHIMPFAKILDAKLSKGEN